VVVRRPSRDQNSKSNNNTKTSRGRSKKEADAGKALCGSLDDDGDVAPWRDVGRQVG